MPLLVILFCFISLICGHFHGWNKRDRSFQIEAVKRGHAAWVVQPDGSTVFVWAGEVQK